MKRDWNSLPDDILLHILSFLSTKQAVQSTSVSKRWVNLWTFLPNLDFDYIVFKKVSHFDEFVDKVLTLRDESVVVKSLIFDHKENRKYEVFERVMSYAAAHGVQHLSIYTDIVHSTCCLRSINTLLTLKLKPYDIYISHLYAYPKENIYFGQLVTLHLENALLVTSDPFSGCPNLENLTLIRCCSHDDLKVLVLSGTRLSKLTIACYGQNPIDCQLVFLSLRLTFLKIVGLRPLDMLFRSNGGLPQFNQIYFDSLDIEDLSNETKQELHSYLTKMLRSLHKAKYITVSVTTVEILGYYPDMLAQEQFPFCNLKSLTFGPSYSRWPKPCEVPARVMDYFTRSSPQAQVDIQVPWFGY